MDDDPRGDMDQISDLLKASTLRLIVRGAQLPEVEIAALFVNERDGPQFFVGERSRAQPLYTTPAREGQHPVAWMQVPGGPISGRLITQNRQQYVPEIEWQPLYLAR